MRHRRDELDAVKAVLEDETYEDADAMAKALVERVYELFCLRDWYGLAWGRYAYGPYMSKTQADKAARALDGLPTVHVLQSVAKMDKVVHDANPTVDPRHCEDCDHPAFAHGFSTPQGCVVRGCECKRVYK